MICIVCGERERKCLSCYDMECGITNLQKKISDLESKIAKQKEKLRIMIDYEKPNRVQRLNEYLLASSK